MQNQKNLKIVLQSLMMQSQYVRNMIRCLALAITSMSALAASFDLKSDYSTTSNPNGPWSYLANDSVPGQSIRGGDAFADPPGAPLVWGGNILGWSQANGSEVANGTPLDLLPGDIYAHTGPVSIRWQSPADGMINLQGGVWMLRDIGRADSFELLVNGAVQAIGGIASGDPFDRANPNTFVFSGGVQSGDIVEFRIVPGGGDYIGLNLSVDLTPSTPVPDSGISSIVLALAALGCGLMKGRGLQKS